MPVNAASGKKLNEAVAENPYGPKGTVDIRTGTYNSPGGESALERLWGWLKKMATPEPEQDPAIVDKMKSMWQGAQSEGKAGWASNYMDFKDFLKRHYRDFASGDTPGESQMGDNRNY
jgi:hypothetical protein